jgi:gliding motility-associated protein GldE
LDIPFTSLPAAIVALHRDFDAPFALVGTLVVLILLVCSALISGSETAYFSLTAGNVDALEKRHSKSAKFALRLLRHPDYLLGTILIVNNVVNVGIVILSSFLTERLLDFDSETLKFVFEVVVITFVLLLCGEILPKIFTRYNPTSFALSVAQPLYAISMLVRPFSFLLVRSTSHVNRRIRGRPTDNISLNDLSTALDVTRTESAEDRKILTGIVKFGNIDVHEIMTPRVDVVAVDIGEGFKDLLKLIVKWEYSRLPVYDETFDNVKGVLYIKDLLAHLEKDDSFAWQALIRPALFVPENKKINDLLEEFQAQKNHLAVVVDEYGGALGIITLEDILEEIVGEISDESDMEELPYKKLNDGTFLFEGKTLLNDFCKLMNLSSDYFDDIAGASETLAGVLLELKGDFPKQGEKICYKQTAFTVNSFDKRRIQNLRVAFDKQASAPQKS